MDGLVTVRDLHPRAPCRTPVFSHNLPVSDRMFTANACDTEELSFSSTIIRVSTVQFFPARDSARRERSANSLFLPLSFPFCFFLSFSQVPKKERESFVRTSVCLPALNYLGRHLSSLLRSSLVLGNDRGTTSRESHLVRVEIKSDR